MSPSPVILFAKRRPGMADALLEVRQLEGRLFETEPGPKTPRRALLDDTNAKTIK